MSRTLYINRSLALRHFPRIIFRNGERLLWNPLTRNIARVRPEERVRLQFIEYLTREAGISSNRIATESPVPSRYSRGRTDILCYDRNFDPQLLIECKAENVTLGSRTATQSAVYNQFVKAPYILLTNGLQDALFHVDTSLNPLKPNDYPHYLNRRNHTDTTPEYWIERGFLHPGMDDRAASELANAASRLFHLSDATKSYIRIQFPTDGMPMRHYYALLPAPGYQNVLFAVSIIAVSEQQSIFCVICNKKGRNIGSLRVLISNSGDFHMPELYLADSQKIATPDISRLVASLLEFQPAGQSARSRPPEETDHTGLYIHRLSEHIASLFFQKNTKITGLI